MNTKDLFHFFICHLYFWHLFKLLSLQSNEVGNSARCENEGLKRCLSLLADAGHAVDVIITDRHKQNEKHIKDNHPHVKHYFDVWHVAKGKHSLCVKCHVMMKLKVKSKLQFYFLTTLAL